MSVPFDERGGALRGLLDVVCGRLPRFVFGGQVAANILPAFHFHDVTTEELEPKLCHLAENGYRTVTADEMAAYARQEIRLDGPHVALCFDDAWASLSTVAAPLLKRYGLTAITYAIPARIEAAAPGFVTWPQLRELQRSGLVDVQCHTDTHSMMFCSPVADGFVTPAYARTLLLNRPQLSPLPALRFLSPDDLGAPLYAARSRMSGARRVTPPADVHERLIAYVTREGGAAFFERLDWKPRLRMELGFPHGALVESESDRRGALDAELDRGRALLNDRLRVTSVNHLCLPWGVSSDLTVAEIKRLGYRSAIANRMAGPLAIRRGDDPYWLKRLPNHYLLHLPGRGRRLWI